MEKEIPGLRYHANIIFNEPKLRNNIQKHPDCFESLKITKHVVEKLESWGYNKTYYGYRDALPGGNVFEEFFRTVKSSKYTITVVTRGFIKNSWGRYKSNSAFLKLIDENKSNKFIALFMDLDDEQIPDELNSMLRLEFGSQWKEQDEEWDKLRRLLEPQHPVQETNEQKNKPTTSVTGTFPRNPLYQQPTSGRKYNLSGIQESGVPPADLLNGGIFSDGPPQDAPQTQGDSMDLNTQAQVNTGQPTEIQEVSGNLTQTQGYPNGQLPQTQENANSHQTQIHGNPNGHQTHAQENPAGQPTQAPVIPHGHQTQAQGYPNGQLTQTPVFPNGHQTQSQGNPNGQLTQAPVLSCGPQTLAKENPNGYPTLAPVIPHDHLTKIKGNSNGNLTQAPDILNGHQIQTNGNFGDNFDTGVKTVASSFSSDDDSVRLSSLDATDVEVDNIPSVPGTPSSNTSQNNSFPLPTNRAEMQNSKPVQKVAPLGRTESKAESDSNMEESLNILSLYSTSNNEERPEDASFIAVHGSQSESAVAQNSERLSDLQQTLQGPSYRRLTIADKKAIMKYVVKSSVTFLSFFANCDKIK